MGGFTAVSRWSCCEGVNKPGGGQQKWACEVGSRVDAVSQVAGWQLSCSVRVVVHMTLECG